MPKTVLITGASGGIGSAVALKFAKNGYNVILHYNSNFPSDLEKKIATYGVKFLSVKADLSDPKEIEEMAKKVYSLFDGVDIIVNNAGICFAGLIQDTDEQAYDRLFNVNMKAPYLIVNKFIDKMISNKYGRVINVSSMWGERGASCEVIYSATKSALIGYSKALAKELGPSGITVNAVLPGVIDTKMNSHLSNDDIAELVASTPVRRLGTSDDVANLIYFLASDEASFITGQAISVDGGFIG